jgi:hypothetical protein
MKKYTDDERSVIMDQINESHKAGLTLEKATKQNGIGVSQYYSWRERLGKPKRKYSKRAIKPSAKHEMVTMSVPPSDTVLLVMGSSQDVKYALDRLATIGRG